MYHRLARLEDKERCRMRRREEMIAGGAGAASTPAFYGRLFNQIFHMKAKLDHRLSGPERNSAGDGERRGRSHALAVLVEPQGLASELVSAIEDTIPVSVWRRAPSRGCKDVPFALDLLASDAEKTLLRTASAPLGLGRPFVAPPGIPGDRLAALRAAMWATFNDPQFRDDCEKQRLECSDPRTSEQVDAIIAQAYATPDNIRKRLIDVYQGGEKKEQDLPAHLLH